MKKPKTITLTLTKAEANLVLDALFLETYDCNQSIKHGKEFPDVPTLADSAKEAEAKLPPLAALKDRLNEKMLKNFW